MENNQYTKEEIIRQLQLVEKNAILSQPLIPVIEMLIGYIEQLEREINKKGS